MIRVIRKVLDVICLAIAIIIISITVMYKKGIIPYVIVTGSMEPKIPVGSMCFIDINYPFQDIQVNEIIMYQSQNQKIIHRVIEKKETSYRTKGDANSKADRADITQEIYLGKFLFSISKVGYFTGKLQSSVSKGIFVTCLIALYILDYLMHYAKKQKKCKE